MFDYTKKIDMGTGGGEWITAKVSAINAAGDLSLLLPGQTAATQKYYPHLSSVAAAVNDMVLCVRYSGTIVVLGKIGGTGGGGGGALPAGGNIYDALVKQSSASGDAVWSPLLYRGSDGGLCEVDAI